MAIRPYNKAKNSLGTFLQKFNVVTPVGMFSRRTRPLKPRALPSCPSFFVFLHILLGDRPGIADRVSEIVHARELKDIKTHESRVLNAASGSGHSVAGKQTNLFVSHGAHKVLAQLIINDRDAPLIDRDALNQKPQ